MTAGFGDRHDDFRAVVSQNRTAIKQSWISSIAAVIGAIIAAGPSYCMGQASSAPAPTDTVTTTAPATGQAAEPTPAETVTVTVPGPTVTVTKPAPGGKQASAPDEGVVYLMDLTPSGDALGEGPQRLAGTTYGKSLSFRVTCSLRGNATATTVYRFDSGYQRFQATVGVADAENTTDVVEFNVYADTDGDGDPDRSEQLGAKAASRDRPAHIDVQLDGATTVILQIRAPCPHDSTAVWGDARVS